MKKKKGIERPYEGRLHRVNFKRLPVKTVHIRHDGDPSVGDPPRRATVELDTDHNPESGYTIFVIAQLERAFKAIWDVAKVDVEFGEENDDSNV